MMPPSIHFSLEQVVDTPAKLHCVMLFAQRTITKGTLNHIAQHVGHDIWSIEQAAKELVEAGILQQTDTDLTQLEYRPKPFFRDALELLTQAYTDPIQRNEIHDYMREISRYAPYRAHFNNVVMI